MTWHHPALGQRTIDAMDREIADLKQRLAVALDQLGKVSAQSGYEIERRREVIAWVESWVSNPVGSYSVHALDGLFGMTRDKIAALQQQSPT